MTDLDRDYLMTTQALSDLEQTHDLDINAGKFLDVRRLINTRTKQTGYFLVNEDVQLLAINESAVGTDLIAGPLPDFAAITIGHLALFWWRTEAAWKFAPGRAPSLPPGTGNHLINQPITEPPQRQESQARKRSLTGWEEILSRGLTDHRHERSLRPHKVCEQIRNTSAMEIFEVWLAIGSIWEALRVPPYRVQNAYAGLDIFMPLQPHMEHEYINKVAGPEKQFIMPLIFPADERLERLGTGQGKGKRKADKDRDVEYIGHLMLAVAHIELRNGGKQTKMEIYDSDPKTYERPMIRERTKAIVENSEWAAPDDQGAHTPIANNTYVRTPKQKANSTPVASIQSLMPGLSCLEFQYIHNHGGVVKVLMENLWLKDWKLST